MSYFKFLPNETLVKIHKFQQIEEHRFNFKIVLKELHKCVHIASYEAYNDPNNRNPIPYFSNVNGIWKWIHVMPCDPCCRAPACWCEYIFFKRKQERMDGKICKDNDEKGFQKYLDNYCIVENEY